MKDELKPQFNAYLDRLRERGKESHIHSRHQMIGLMIADTLEDQKHKALYIKMARDENGEKMLYLAKSIAENSSVVNKGAYFMRVWQLENAFSRPSSSPRRVSPKPSRAKKEKRESSPKKSVKKKKPTKKKKNGTRNSKKSE
jgi:hypothetical protein